MTKLIAEIGINHNGNLDTAKRLIDAAKWAGADMVKFQKRTVGTVYAGQLDQPRESPWGTTLGEQKHHLEFDRPAWDMIVSHCDYIRMPVFASAWDLEALEFLSAYNMPVNKIASAMLTHDEFVKAVGRQGKPVMLSTGLSEMWQVNRAVGLLEIEQCPDITVMHCVGVYPCPESDLNLAMIAQYRDQFPNYTIGYSGHEASVSPSVIAAVLGAEAIERHITLDRTMYGSDQAASLEPHGFKQMVDQIRKIPVVMGDGVKRVTDGEKSVAKKLRYFE